MISRACGNPGRNYPSLIRVFAVYMKNFLLSIEHTAKTLIRLDRRVGAHDLFGFVTLWLISYLYITHNSTE